MTPEAIALSVVFQRGGYHIKEKLFMCCRLGRGKKALQESLRGERKQHLRERRDCSDRKGSEAQGTFKKATTPNKFDTRDVVPDSG